LGLQPGIVSTLQGIVQNGRHSNPAVSWGLMLPASTVVLGDGHVDIGMALLIVFEIKVCEM
jgi:hypothetical protein